MEKEAIVEALQPVADLACTVMKASQDLMVIVRCGPTFKHQYGPKLEKLIDAVKAVSNSSTSFPTVYVPAMYYETIKSLRLEADVRLEQLLTLADQYEEAGETANESLLKELENQGVIGFQKQHLPLTRRFYDIALRSPERAYNGEWYAFKLQTQDGEWTRDYNGSLILKYIVVMRSGTLSNEFDEFVKTLPDKGNGMKKSQISSGRTMRGYVTGLTTVERELLSVNSMVFRVAPYEPSFIMELAFD